MGLLIVHDNWPQWFQDWCEREIKKNNGKPIKIEVPEIKIGEASKFGQALANKLDNDILGMLNEISKSG